MPTLTPKQILQIWEDGQAVAPWLRAMLLLETAEPGLSRNDLAQLPIGERDARLLGLRQEVFGDALSSLAHCPKCNEQLELSFAVDDVRLPPPETQGPWTFEDGTAEIAFDLPTSSDLESLVPGREASDALLSACIREMTMDDAPATIGDLSSTQRAALVAYIAETDPRADTKAAVACPRCAHTWSAQFDIVAFFWEEIGAWVRRILSEVHILARAYGWCESDVLALSAWRRKQYLALARP